MKCLCFIAPDTRTGGEVTGVFLNTHRTLVAVASNAGPTSDVVSIEARANEVVIDASDAMASDAGQTLAASNGYVTSAAPSNPLVH
jgi:hypothetical protein